MIEKIIFTGDLLRNYAPPRSSHPADGFIKEIFFLLSAQLKEVSNLPICYVTNEEKNIFDRDVFFRLCKKKVSTDSWVSIYSEDINKDALKYFKDCFSNSLIIFQEAGSLKKYADASNIPYINMFISSIRFTEDVNFAIQTNVDTIREKLNKYRVNELEFSCQANLIKAYYNLRKKISLKKNACLLCGQTPIDLSVIKNKKLYSLLDVLPKLEELSKKYSVIYYKPHPNVKKNSDIEKVIQKLPYIELVEHNIYQILASEEIVAVAALSSSVLKEAVYFNKEVHILLHPYIEYYQGKGNILPHHYQTVTHECFSTDFWSDTLSDVIQTQKVEYFNFKNDANFLRKLTKCYQGYQADDSLAVDTNKSPQFLKLEEKQRKNEASIYYINHHTFFKMFKYSLLKQYFNIKCFFHKSKENLLEQLKYQNILNKINMSSNKGGFSNITVVLQGSTLSKYNGISCVEFSVASIRKVMPDCKIILSTWKGENVPKNLLVDKIILNEDPGYATRDCTPEGKKNNVNRQIVSTLAGINEVKTPYCLKLRTDFILNNTNFLNKHNKFRKFDKKYRIFERRIICSMFDTRKAKGVYYNLPFHIGDLFYYGLTSDLKNLFDIPLVTQEEFNWFIDHKEIIPDTFARNKYNAEQSIWINCLRKNGKNIQCQYSTDLTETNAVESDLFMVNNFVPYSFKKFGALPLKLGLRAPNRILTYCDNFTYIEWKQIYQKYCDKAYKFKKTDPEKNCIALAIKMENSKYPKFIKKLLRYWVNLKAEKLFDK